MRSSGADVEQESLRAALSADRRAHVKIAVCLRVVFAAGSVGSADQPSRSLTNPQPADQGLGLLGRGENNLGYARRLVHSVAYINKREANCNGLHTAAPFALFACPIRRLLWVARGGTGWLAAEGAATTLLGLRPFRACNLHRSSMQAHGQQRLLKAQLGNGRKVRRPKSPPPLPTCLSSASLW